MQAENYQSENDFFFPCIHFTYFSVRFLNNSFT